MVADSERARAICHAVVMLPAIAASAAAALAWLYLLAWHGGYWRTDQRLPASSPPPAWPAVVAVVPARDEASVLPQTLPTLLTQDYPGSLSIVLVDDESSDGTARVASELAAKLAPGRLEVICGSPTPAGWAGKVWAMAQGVAAAGETDYLLFTDADIGYAPATLRKLVAAMADRAIVSQMALLRADTAAERMLIPAFVYFFAQLYPFRRVNAGRSRVAAAAGGCMLVRGDALAAAGGLDQIKGARIDDVALGGLLKGAGHGCWLGFTTDVTSEREYTELSEVWDMVARSAYTQLRYSPLALAGTVLGLAWLYLLPPAATLAGLGLAAAGLTGAGLVSTGLAVWLAVAGLTAWTLMTATYLPMLALYRLSPLRAPSLPLIAALYAAMTLTSARRHYSGRGGEWKGRLASQAPDEA